MVEIKAFAILLERSCRSALGRIRLAIKKATARHALFASWICLTSFERKFYRTLIWSLLSVKLNGTRNTDFIIATNSSVGPVNVFHKEYTAIQRAVQLNNSAEHARPTWGAGRIHTHMAAFAKPITPLTPRHSDVAVGRHQLRTFL